MKKNFRRFVLTIYLLTLAAVSQAQVLKGTVSDAATGEVLIGASIQLKGTTSGTITDIDGRFELKDLKEGNHRLVISYIFYRTAEIDVEVKAENQELNIGLELDGQQLSEVTGKGKPLPVESAETENAPLKKVSRLSGVAISGTLDSKEGIYTAL